MTRKGSPVLALFLCLSILTANRAISQNRPNVIIIITDDQRYEDISEAIMPNTWKTIFNEGTEFSKAYVTTPACCPSRASILTSLYASRHEVIKNAYILSKRTVVQSLKDSGYRTGIVGKYLNTWDGRPRHEFDFWVSFRGGSASYFDPLLNIKGKWKRKKGYITSILGEYAREFIANSIKEEEPFLLIFSPNAPHSPARPHPNTYSMFENYTLDYLPSFNESDRSDKSFWLKRMHSLSPKRASLIASLHRKQLRTLWTLDEEIGLMLEQLKNANKLNCTAIFFISDNGLMLGEHTLQSKDVPYEGAIHVPFALRYPPLTDKTKNINQLVANIDIPATVYDLAQVSPPYRIDGLSLVKLFEDQTQWRKHLLIEGWRQTQLRRPFAAIHTGSHIYIRYKNDLDELYDLETDPYQLDNAAYDQKYLDLKSELRGELRNMLSDIRGTVSFNKPRGKQRSTTYPPPKEILRKQRKSR